MPGVDVVKKPPPARRTVTSDAATDCRLRAGTLPVAHIDGFMTRRPRSSEVAQIAVVSLSLGGNDAENVTVTASR